MVSFQCDACGDVVTRKKLDSHIGRCGAPVMCLDCQTTFYGGQHKSHTTCISEDQKYMGGMYKEKKPKNKAAKETPAAMSTAKHRDKQPTVEDASDTSPVQASMQIATVEVPPPAPSPPQSANVPNVFDFLISETSPAATPALPAPANFSSPKRKRRTSASSAESFSSSDESSRPASRHKSGAEEEDMFSYGNEPIGQMSLKYGSYSNLPALMDVDSQQPQNRVAYETPHETPHDVSRLIEASQETLSQAKSALSDKKRKRKQVEELDLSDSRPTSAEPERDSRAALHTGLTGGLSKLMGYPESQTLEASPLSPKKKPGERQRAEAERHSKNDTRRSKHESDDEEDRHRRQRRKKHRHHDADEERHYDAKSSQKQKEISAVEYQKQQVNGHSNISRPGKPRSNRGYYSSNSEFFLSLVDKGPNSAKGQSIWGALKMFHEGMLGGMSEEAYRSSGALDREQKRLMKALRIKAGRNGEIVMFALPEYEDDDETLSVKRRITAG